MKLIKITLSIILFSFLPKNKSFSWGFFAHRKINRLAIFCLPLPIFHFYKKNIKYITTNSVNPDKRRCAVEGEAEKHFIDLDRYSQDEIQNLYSNWYVLIDLYGEKNLRSFGIIPWNILKMKEELTKAFAEKNIERILKLSSEVGHYLADANVPLHTTKNYNGQLTDQYGIHSFWETRLVELFFEDYDFFELKADYVINWKDKVWESIFIANSFVKIILELEKDLSNDFRFDKFCYEKRGSVLQKVYSFDFSKKFHDKLQNMVENQMKKSVKIVSDFWYSCWIDAGSPNLDDINLNENIKIEEENYENQKKLESFRDCC